MLLGACLAAPRNATGEDLDAVVAATVRENYEALHDCYRRVLAQDRLKHGTLFVRVVLGQGDGISSAKIERDELGSDEHVACVLSWVRGWTLKGASAAGVASGAEILLPLTFRAAPGQFAVRLEDTPEIALTPKATARILLSPQNVAAQQASMVHLDIRGQLALIGHPKVEQLLYVMNGTGQLENAAAKQRWPLSRGSFAWVPADAFLELSGTLSVLQIFVPAGLEQEYMPGRAPVSGAQVRWPILGHAKKKGARPGARGKPLFTPLLHQDMLSHARFYLGLIDAPPENTVPLNTHRHEAELVFILEGQGQAVCGGVSTLVGPGEALYLPAGTPHQMTVSREMRAIQIFVPAGPEQRFIKQTKGKKK